MQIQIYLRPASAAFLMFITSVTNELTLGHGTLLRRSKEATHIVSLQQDNDLSK